MKVILLKDIETRGRAGDAKDVSAGFFRNFLLPRQLAKIATPALLREATALQDRHKREWEKQLAEFRALVDSLAEEKIVFEESATAEGQLYGSVSAGNIVARLREKGFPDVLEEQVTLEAPLKMIGEYTVPLRFGGIEGVISVIIQKRD